MIQGLCKLNQKLQNQNNVNMNNKKLNTKKTTPDSNKLLYEKLAVIVKTKEGKIFQVALNKEMADALLVELKMFFKDGIVKILPSEIHGITIE